MNLPIPSQTIAGSVPARDADGREPFGRLETLGELPLLDSMTQWRDPETGYQELRREWGRPVVPVWLERGVPGWLVLDYDSIEAITRSPQTFSHDPRDWRQYTEGGIAPDSGLRAIMIPPRDNCFYTNGNEHERLRRPLIDAVATVNEQRLQRLVRGICEQLLAPHTPARRIDLVRDYAQPVPLLAVAALFGLPPGTRMWLCQAMATVFASTQDSARALAEVEALLIDTLRTHATGDGDDLTSVIAQHNYLATDRERIDLMVLTLTAGWQTTSTWIAQCLLTLLTDPRFTAQIHGGSLSPDDAPNLVLRNKSPMTHMPGLYARKDTVIAGQPVSAGDPVILGLAAGNFDLLRRTGTPQPDNEAHLAWGRGPHRCPADRIARVITTTAVRTVLETTHDVTLTRDPGSLGVLPGPWTSCPASMPVTFDLIHAAATA